MLRSDTEMANYCRFRGGDDSAPQSTETDVDNTAGSYDPFELNPPSGEEMEPCMDQHEEPFSHTPCVTYAVTFICKGETYFMQMNGAALVALQSIAPGCPFTAVQI